MSDCTSCASCAASGELARLGLNVDRFDFTVAVSYTHLRAHET